jgi:phosphatidylglycerophosphate synthase
MQVVISVPEVAVLRSYPEAAGVLAREIVGVPLLPRVIATAMRAGGDSLLVIWPPDLHRSNWERCAASPLLKGLPIKLLVRHFDPKRPDAWSAIVDALEDDFLWLPWNFITHKWAMAELKPVTVRPPSWDLPVRLKKQAEVGIESGPRPVQGVTITPQSNVVDAERFLVTHSGKLTDGIYSRFNRMLCRPAVRVLAHTPVTPNLVTLGGLIVAVFAAFQYARGFYAAYVAGALLFFVSGLFDEMDGMLARVKFHESAFGTWFEGLVDEATYLMLFAGITAGLYRERGHQELTYGYALIIGVVLAVIVTRVQRRLATSPDRPHEYAGRLNRLLEADSTNLISRVVRQIHIFIKKGVAVHYIVIFTVLGGLPLLLRLAALGANLTWTLALYFNWKFFRRRPVNADAVKQQSAMESL